MTQPLGRKRGPIPEFAKNQTDLGAYMMPPRDRKIIQRAMRLEGNPGRTPDNRYRISDWQTFINANFEAHARPEEAPDKRRLEEEKLRLTNDKLRFQLQVMQREYSRNSDIAVWIGDLVMQAKRVLQAIPGKLAPVVIGLTEVEAELRMKEEINSALAQLSSRPLHGDYDLPVAPLPVVPEQPAAAPAIPAP
jgi:hypothetical protein